MYRRNFIFAISKKLPSMVLEVWGGESFNLYSEVGFWTPEGGSFWNFFPVIKVLKASLIILLWKHKTSSLALNLVGSQENCWSVLWLCLLWKIYYMGVQGERPLGSKNKRSIKEALTWRTGLWLPRGTGGGGMTWEFGTSRCKPLHITWINNEVLLSSTGNYIWYPEIKHNEKEY